MPQLPSTPRTARTARTALATLAVTVLCGAGACTSTSTPSSNPANPANPSATSSHGSSSTAPSSAATSSDDASPDTGGSGTTEPGPGDETRTSVYPTGSGLPADATACDVVTATDLTAAGIAGTVRPGEDASSRFSIGSEGRGESACDFTVTTEGAGGNVYVVIAPGGGAALFTSAQDGFAAKTEDLADLGDQAVYETGKPDDRGQFDQTILVLAGDTVIKVSTPASNVVSRDALAALAGTVAGRVG